MVGAAGGIGADAARHLASGGYRVILVARRQGLLELVARSIGERAAIEICDASSGDQALALRWQPLSWRL
ncbi:MAG: SDR family NAD(P)-dependent oxidoreductase [Burkholderiales bacterium]